jgi:hypothetical protein
MGTMGSRERGDFGGEGRRGLFFGEYNTRHLNYFI